MRALIALFTLGARHGLRSLRINATVVNRRNRFSIVDV